jgi:hypothetical protein
MAASHPGRGLYALREIELGLARAHGGFRLNVDSVLLCKHVTKHTKKLSSYRSVSNVPRAFRQHLPTPSLHPVRISFDNKIRLANAVKFASATTTSGAYSTPNTCSITKQIRFACFSSQNVKSSGSPYSV